MDAILEQQEECPVVLVRPINDPPTFVAVEIEGEQGSLKAYISPAQYAAFGLRMVTAGGHLMYLAGGPPQVPEAEPVDVPE